MTGRFDLKEGAIVIARPLYELKSHITHFHIPDLYVLARAVKVIALSIFRWHFYDTDSVMLANATNYIHDLSGKIETQGEFAHQRPYFIRSATIFSPKDNRFHNKIQFTNVSKLGSMSLTNVVSYLGAFDAEFKKGTMPWNHPGYINATQ